MAKTPAKGKSENAALADKLIAHQAKAHNASARVNLLHAQIELKGKKVVYDYTKGEPVPKVVDRLKGGK